MHNNVTTTKYQQQTTYLWKQCQTISQSPMGQINKTNWSNKQQEQNCTNHVKQQQNNAKSAPSWKYQSITNNNQLKQQ